MNKLLLGGNPETTEKKELTKELRQAKRDKDRDTQVVHLAICDKGQQFAALSIPLKVYCVESARPKQVRGVT